MNVYPFFFEQEFPADPWQLAIGFMVKEAENVECFWCGEQHPPQNTFWGLQFYRDGEKFCAALGFDCAEDPDLLTHLLHPIATRIDSAGDLVWIPKPATELDEFRDRASSQIEPSLVQNHQPFAAFGPEVEVLPVLLVQGTLKNQPAPAVGWIAGDRRATGWEAEVIPWLERISLATGRAQDSLLAANPFS